MVRFGNLVYLTLDRKDDSSRAARLHVKEHHYRHPICRLDQLEAFCPHVPFYARTPVSAGQGASAQSNRSAAAGVFVVSMGKSWQEAVAQRPSGGLCHYDQWKN
jgi:hypothetical protein